MEQPPVMPPVTPAALPVKKGLPPLAWVGIGCGGLLLIGIIVVIGLGLLGANKMKEMGVDFQKNPERAAAEMVVSMRPDLEKISTNEEAGTITVRNKDGKEMTLTYKEISEGKDLNPDAVMPPVDPVVPPTGGEEAPPAEE